MSNTNYHVRYDRLSTRAALNAIPGFRWCIAPFCDSGQIHDSEGSIMTCTECKFRTCTNCDREFHDGETCDEYTERMGIQEDLIKQSEEAIEQMAKQCPGCKTRIEKNGGCDHMTCKLPFPLSLSPVSFSHFRLSQELNSNLLKGQKCRRQFCWLCDADYKDINRDGNTAHAETCRYHSGNIPDPHNPGAYAHARAFPLGRQPMMAPAPAPAPAPMPVQPLGMLIARLQALVRREVPAAPLPAP